MKVPAPASRRRDRNRLATVADYAAGTFAPPNPPFRRVPVSLSGWLERAAAEFAFFGMVEVLLKFDDKELEAHFRAMPEEHIGLAEEFNNLHKRWAAGAAILNTMAVRLCVVGARYSLADEARPPA